MKPSIFEKGTDTNRNLIALILIGLTIIAIIVISSIYLSSATDAEKKAVTAEKIFNALLPMFATWVGTVLAFYFGRENFESATKRYEKIITQLTPDVLDDITVEQIMIDIKTMVVQQLVDCSKKNIKELAEFLESINKSRMPVLENEKIKYIIHKSVFDEAVRKKDNQPIKFDDFIKEYNPTVTSFITAYKTDKLEQVLEKMQKQTMIQDVFIVDGDGKVIGWLTNSLIFRYINKKI